MPLAASPSSPLARRLGTLVVGLVLVSLGVALMIRAEVGVAPYDVLNTGLADALDIPIGAAAMIVPLLFVGLGLALGGSAGFGTAAAVALVGPTLGGFLALLPDPEAMLVRIPYFVTGTAVLASGITAVIVAEVGAGPAEVLMLAIHRRSIDLAVARTGMEIVAAAAGAAMGGQLGVGTVLFALSIGPILRSLLRRCGYDAVAAADRALVAEPGA